MNIEQIFSQRLRNARVMKGYSYRTFADALNNIVSAQTLRNYEKGLSFPDSSIMDAILNVLNTKIDALFRPLTIDWSQVEFNYRKKSTISGTKSEEIMQNVQDKAERYIELLDIMAIPFISSECISQCHSNVVYTNADARNIAMCARNSLGLLNEPIANMQEAVERMGVKLLPIDTDKSFDGVHFVCNGHIFICYNNLVSNIERERFTIAHELGHLLLNIPDTTNKKQVESLCNSFASEFLLPSQKLFELLGENRKNIALQELKNIQSLYGISVDAIMQAARDLNVITENRFKTYHILKNKGVINKAYVDKSIFEEKGTDRFENLIYRALSSDMISISKAAYLLNKSVNEVSENITYV